jgi:hypothetical protein
MKASTEKLSISDLCKLDEERLRTLPYDQLQEVSVNLLHEFKVAVDRLHQTPQNSSVPSSSIPPWATLTKLAAAANPQVDNVTRKDSDAQKNWQ